MSRSEDVDPTAATFADDRAPGVVWTTPTSGMPPIDPRADTIPSDGALTTPPPSGLALDPLLGRMLGHFRVDALIGRGGMGSVYRAWDVSLLRPVALKVLISDSASARSRFLREARSQAQLRHPNVVPIHYVGESDGIVFLVMDLVEGESLNDLIRREGRVAPERALDIVDAVANALGAGQAAGLIHRDVKPSNILLERSGRALLADFGLAKDIAAAEIAGDGDGAPTSLRAAGLTRAGSIVGTPAYLAPEQAAGGPVDHRADMYALGASLFEALTGAPPFDAPTPTAIVERQRTETARSPRALVADLHPSLEQLVLRLLHRDAAGRFATYEELRTAIAHARMPVMAKAPPVPRAVAFAIDAFLALLTFIALAAAITWLGLEPVAIPVSWVVTVTAFSLAERHFGGQSLGKRLMQMRVADRYGLAPGFGVILARNALVASVLPTYWLVDTVFDRSMSRPLMSLTTILWAVTFLPALGTNRLTLHDRLTRSRVIFAESPSPRPDLRG